MKIQYLQLISVYTATDSFKLRGKYATGTQFKQLLVNPNLSKIRNDELVNR